MNRLTKDDLNDIMFALLEKVHDYRQTLKLLENSELKVRDYYEENINRFLELYDKVLEIYKKAH